MPLIEPVSTAALVGSTLFSSATVVAQQSPQVAGQVAVRGEILGLARDAVGVEEPSLDSERLAQGEVRVLTDPSSEDPSPFGDQPRLPVVLLAVEEELGFAELRAQLSAQVSDVHCLLRIGQAEVRSDDQGPPLHGRGNDHYGERLLLIVCHLVDEFHAIGPGGLPRIHQAKGPHQLRLIDGRDREP
ncbi:MULTISPECIES: hypothetical protein [Streptomyces]|uniref:Uncharacterized protein n=2 Tax=Streptomyces TaxID=1883 RepID=A0ABV9IZX6_9ACTN